MNIRAAKIEDYDVVPELMFSAMEEFVFSYIQSEDIEEGINFLRKFFREEDNLFSYKNVFVIVDEEQNIYGAVNSYKGADFKRLISPILKHIAKKYSNSLDYTAESDDSEYYIDNLSIVPSQQGKGLGKKLINHIIEHSKTQGYKKVGLLVNTQKTKVIKLYEHLGFEKRNLKELVGEDYFHMTINL